MIVKETGQYIDGDIINNYTKRKIDFSLFSGRDCVKCGEGIVKRDTTKLTQSNEFIIVQCLLDYNQYKSVVCKECLPKLNPNSFEYNMIKFGISYDSAKQLIYSRNKSPFYQSSHEDYDSYRKFQSHEHFSREKKEEIQIKQDEGRSRWAEQYVATHGHESMKELKDSSSKKHFQQKYGADWENYYKEKTEKTRRRTYSEIVTADEMLLYLKRRKINNGSDLKIFFDKLTSNSNIISRLYLLEKKEPNKNTFPFICWRRLYGDESLYNSVGMSRQKSFVEKRVIPNQEGWVYTGIVDGHFFRSGQEIDAYYNFEESGIKVLHTNKSYPNSSRQYYDLMIQDMNANIHYIEIIGSNDQRYKTKLIEREKKYGSILLLKKHLSRLISDIKSNKDITKEKYNDW